MDRPDTSASAAPEVDFSIIVPCYYNAGNIGPTFQALKENVFDRERSWGRSFELIFVDDGSGDETLAELLKVKEANDFVRVIKFTRNFGQTNALLAGLAHARGRCCIHISADLQDPPGMIRRMLAIHFGQGRQVVICEREARDESGLRSLTSRLFYGLIRRIGYTNMPIGGFDFFLIGRPVRDILVNTKERAVFIQGSILATGYPPVFIPYRRMARKIGKSRWTFAKKLTYLIDGVASSSYIPIRLMSIIGAAVAFLGFVYAIVILALKLTYGKQFSVEGWAPIMIMLLVLSGTQMLMLGVIGEYLWRTLDVSRGRERYVIDRIYE